MTLLLASFASPDGLIAAARAAHGRGLAITDALTPFPVEGIDEFLPADDRGVRAIMLGSGVTFAGLAYGLEWWSAVIAYPFNSGNRPLHSWPVFLLFPFEFGVLAAAVAGLIVFLFRAGFPDYRNPILQEKLFARSTVDAFVLAVQAPQDHDAQAELMEFFAAEGAKAVTQVET